MTVINSFLKKRIEQMVKECESPLEVFEQLEEVMEFESDEEVKELMDYLISLWMETPQENLLGNSPRDFMEKALAREMGVELDEDEETLMDELMDIAEEDLMHSLSRAAEILNDKIKYSRREIQKKKFKLSAFHDEISNLSLMHNIQKFLEYISERKSGSIQMEYSGVLKTRDVNKIKKNLGDYPELIKLDPFGQNNKNVYIDFINFISLKTRLTEKKKIKGKRDKKIILTDKGRQFISGENFDEIYPKLFIKWIINKDPVVIFSEETGFLNFNYSYNESHLVYGLLLIGKEWINIEDAFIPVMAFGNADVGIILEEHSGGEEGLRELQRISCEFDDMEIEYFKQFGIIEKRSKEGFCDEIKLTELGYNLLDQIFNKYHILCRLNAKLMFVKINFDYLDFMLFYGMRLKSELEDDEIYEDFCNLCMEHEAILAGFIRGFEILEEDRKEAKKFEAVIDEYIGRLDENMKVLKERFYYDNRRREMLKS